MVISNAGRSPGNINVNRQNFSSDHEDQKREAEV